jgi:hypothetical protein
MVHLIATQAGVVSRAKRWRRNELGLGDSTEPLAERLGSEPLVVRPWSLFWVIGVGIGAAFGVLAFGVLSKQGPGKSCSW